GKFLHSESPLSDRQILSFDIKWQTWTWIKRRVLMPARYNVPRRVVAANSACETQNIQCIGTVISPGKITNSISNNEYTSRNGNTPHTTRPNGTRATPLTTFNTTPTGGVSRPMQLFMMNMTPKYTGSMPASVTTGMS